MEVTKKVKGDVFHRLYKMCTNNDISREEVREFETLFDTLFHYLTEDEFDDLLSVIIDNDNSYLKLYFIDNLSKLKETISWIPQFLLLLIRDPDEAVSIKSMNLLEHIGFQGLEKNLLSEVEKIMGGRQNLSDNIPIYNRRELTALRIRNKIHDFKNNSVITGSERVYVDLSNMVLIPAGHFVKGVEQIIKAPIVNTLELAYPSQKIFLKDYYMDKYPVTNKEYDQFCEAIEENGHIWCHPDEDCNKTHRRSTFYNYSALPNQPVTGIDWYDAYAFAAWKGKRLPTADQWEKAARGINGCDFQSEENLINSFIHAFSIEDFTMDKWREILLEKSDVLKTHSVYEKSNKSPFGIFGMIGNTWEWTRTRYLDQKNQEPSFRGMDRSLIWDDWSGWTIIKGGSFTSVGELLHPAFYDKRLLIERNIDVGFRCVYEI